MRHVSDENGPKQVRDAHNTLSARGARVMDTLSAGAHVLWSRFFLGAAVSITHLLQGRHVVWTHFQQGCVCYDTLSPRALFGMVNNENF